MAHAPACGLVGMVQIVNILNETLPIGDDSGNGHPGYLRRFEATNSNETLHLVWIALVHNAVFFPTEVRLRTLPSLPWCGPAHIRGKS